MFKYKSQIYKLLLYDKLEVRLNKIKILQVIGTLRIGGAENVAMNFLRYIDKNKYQCDFLVYSENKEGYEEEAKQLGAQIIRISSPKKGYYNYYKNIKKILLEGKYDIIHSHTMLSNGIVLKAAYSAGVNKRISHAHSSEAGKKENIIYKLYTYFMKKSINKYATDFVSCSESAGLFLYGKKIFEEKGIIIPNTIETDKYKFNTEVRKQMRKKMNIDNNFVIGNVGRLADVKNHIFLLDIFKEFHKNNENSILLIVGEGELRNELELKIKELNLEDNVILTGARDDVPELLQVMDVFVFPSRFEGLGIAIIEAQATGLYCFISENLPKELNVTNNITRISLYESAQNWAEEITRLVDYNRTDTSKEIIKAGYDTINLRKYIEKLYSDNNGDE